MSNYRVNPALAGYMGGGLGCSECGGTCAKCRGLGLFDEGFDPSSFGWMEWAVLLGLGYMIVSTVFTTGRAARAVAAIPGERRKRRAARLRARAKELTSRR